MPVGYKPNPDRNMPTGMLYEAFNSPSSAEEGNMRANVRIPDALNAIMKRGRNSISPKIIRFEKRVPVIVIPNVAIEHIIAVPINSVIIRGGRKL